MTADLPGLVQQIAHFEARLGDDPGSRVFLPLADLYRRTGNLERARQLLTEGLASTPRFVSARAALGDILFSLGDLAAARQEMREVLDHDPENVLALRLLAGDAATRGEWEAARSLAERLLRLLPEDAEVRKLLREVRAGQAHAPATPPEVTTPTPPTSAPLPVREAPVAEGVLGIGTGMETPTLADLYRRQGYPQKARAILQRILAAEPNRQDARDVLARLDEAAPAADSAGALPAHTAVPSDRPAPPPAAGRANGKPLQPAPDLVVGRPVGRSDDLDRFRAWLDRASGPRDP